MTDLDPRTPVLVGVGQFAERIDDPDAIAASVDAVAGVRQFEISHPGARAPRGRSDNYPRRRLEDDDRRVIART